MNSETKVPRKSWVEGMKHPDDLVFGGARTEDDYRLVYQANSHGPLLAEVARLETELSASAARIEKLEGALRGIAEGSRDSISRLIAKDTLNPEETKGGGSKE